MDELERLKAEKAREEREMKTKEEKDRKEKEERERKEKEHLEKEAKEKAEKKELEQLKEEKLKREEAEQKEKEQQKLKEEREKAHKEKEERDRKEKAKIQKKLEEQGKKEREEIEKEKLRRETDRKEKEKKETERMEMEKAEQKKKDKESHPEEDVDDDAIIMNVTDIIDEEDDASQDTVSAKTSKVKTDVFVKSVKETLSSPKKSAAPKPEVEKKSDPEEPIHFRRLVRTASKAEPSQNKKSAKWSSNLKEDPSGLVSSSLLMDIVPDIKNILEEVSEVPELAADEMDEGSKDADVEDVSQTAEHEEEGQAVESLQVFEEELEEDSVKPDAKPVPNENGHKNGDDLEVEKPKPILATKKISSETLSKGEKTCVVDIVNLVRPFTVKQVYELLERTGKIVDGRFWMDNIKSKVIVQVIRGHLLGPFVRM